MLVKNLKFLMPIHSGSKTHFPLKILQVEYYIKIHISSYIDLGSSIKTPSHVLIGAVSHLPFPIS